MLAELPPDILKEVVVVRDRPNGAPGQLGIPGGVTPASRAALARAVAHGLKPALAVERGGQRYVLAAR